MKNQTPTKRIVSLNSSSLQAITDAIATERARAATEELDRLCRESRKSIGSQGALNNRPFSILR